MTRRKATEELMLRTARIEDAIIELKSRPTGDYSELMEMGRREVDARLLYDAPNLAQPGDEVWDTQNQENVTVTGYLYRAGFERTEGTVPTGYRVRTDDGDTYGRGFVYFDEPQDELPPSLNPENYPRG